MAFEHHGHEPSGKLTGRPFRLDSPPVIYEKLKTLLGVTDQKYEVVRFDFQGDTLWMQFIQTKIRGASAKAHHYRTKDSSLPENAQDEDLVEKAAAEMEAQATPDGWIGIYQSHPHESTDPELRPLVKIDLYSWGDRVRYEKSARGLSLANTILPCVNERQNLRNFGPFVMSDPP